MIVYDRFTNILVEEKLIFAQNSEASWGMYREEVDGVMMKE